MSPKKKPAHKSIAENRKARHNYAIDDVYEAGIMLMGSEVKSLRTGKINIAESYASEEGGEIFLVNAYIPEYGKANRFNHATRRPRKLLLHRREISKLVGAIQKQGQTLVPLRMYFNDKGIAKLELALATGKKAHDKRQTIKERDWNRQKSRLLRHSS